MTFEEEHGKKVVSVELTIEEVLHLKRLAGKDIGWHRQRRTGKEVIAGSIYGKLARVESENRLRLERVTDLPF